MITIDTNNFKDEVLTTDVLVLIEFYSPKCETCLDLMEDIEEEIPAKYGDQLKLGKIDITENQALNLEFKVMGLPAVLLFKDGKKVSSMMGKSINVEEIEEEIKKYC